MSKPYSEMTHDELVRVADRLLATIHNAAAAPDERADAEAAYGRLNEAARALNAHDKRHVTGSIAIGGVPQAVAESLAGVNLSP